MILDVNMLRIARCIETGHGKVQLRVRSDSSRCEYNVNKRPIILPSNTTIYIYSK
jgi:hypothetical protein